MLDARRCLGSHNVLFITLDTLRFDVADAAMRDGATPVLAELAGGDWERRHSPATFTYAAHTAFFAGFLPTPSGPRGARAPRLFATQFPGSRTTHEKTVVFDQDNIVAGFAEAGYRTICIGGVGFFNKRSALGSVLPGYFQESYWTPDLGVECLASTEHQVALACDLLSGEERPVFMFLNVSACHMPHRGYVPGATRDTVETQRAALEYVDGALAPLLAAIRQARPTLVVICADHGEAFGEDGYVGHRLAHPTVWEVPYLETILT